MNQDTKNIRARQSLALLFLVTLTACESSDLPIQHADSYNYITFSAQTERQTTRTNDYENYDPEKHPGSMGVYGYYDIDEYNDLKAAQAFNTPNPIFDNTKLTYNTSSQLWDYDNPKKWNDYKGAKTFDFFAYMPKTDDSKLTRTNDDTNTDNTNTYTLTIPFTIPSATAASNNTTSSATGSTNASPLFFDVKQAPVICAKPVHKQATDANGKELAFERVINLQFDQTLTAFNLQFMLDKKMNTIRQFRIKGVTISGELATSGTISRTYTWNKDGKQEWTAGDILWTNLSRKTFSASDISIPYKESADKSSNNDNKTVIVDNSGYTPWGDTFYVIPDEKFNPTISVTYDTEFTDQDGKTVVTRKDVTSTIMLNKSNFNNLATTEKAIIHPIRILILPRYLYVLSDDDAYTGHLLVE